MQSPATWEGTIPGTSIRWMPHSWKTAWQKMTCSPSWTWASRVLWQQSGSVGCIMSSTESFLHLSSSDVTPGRLSSSGLLDILGRVQWRAMKLTGGRRNGGRAGKELINESKYLKRWCKVVGKKVFQEVLSEHQEILFHFDSDWVLAQVA